MSNENPKGLNKYFAYSKERFPIPGILVYAGTLFYVAFCFGNLFSHAGQVEWLPSIGGVLLFFLVILHLRILDEHKDYEADKTAYPDRLLSRGVITLADLRRILVAVVIIELGVSALLGIQQLIIWGIIFAWSMLMFYEFFASEFLKKHIGLYLVSHQLLVPVMVFYAVSLRVDIAGLDTTGFLYILLLSASIMCATVTYEIARKTWSKEQEHELADSYTSEWGIKTAVVINQLVALCGGAIMVYLYSRFNAGIVYHSVIAVLFLIFLLTGAGFVKSPSKKMSKMVEAGGMLYMLGLFVNSIIFFW